MKFELRYPTEIFFGNGTFEMLGNKSVEYGKRIFLVTGKSAMHKSGVLVKAMKILKDSSAEVIYLYDKAEHDPSVETVDNGVNLVKNGNFDVVVGIGGGSALDVAKTIACLVKNEGSAGDYLSGKEINYPGIPFIAVPTTAGTGAEITKNSVITDTKKKLKQSIRSNYMIAKAAIIDPLLTVSMPPYITSASGMDALTQAIECYVSLSANPVSSALAIESISLISRNILRAFINGNDLQARENMALGSLLGAMAFANASLGAVHGLAHPIGAMFDVPHGVICALLLPHVMEFNLPVRKLEFAQIAEAMGHDISVHHEDSAYLAISFVKDLLSKLNMPQHLKDLGINESDLDVIAYSAKGSSLNSNPRPVSPEILVEILSRAM